MPRHHLTTALRGYCSTHCPRIFPFILELIMIHKIFSIRDAAADAFLPPFVLPKTDMAKRTFGACVNSEDHQFAAYPEDYTLMEIGTFDDETGFVTQDMPPKSLGNGLNYVTEPTPELTNGASQQSESPVQSESPSENPPE